MHPVSLRVGHLGPIYPQALTHVTHLYRAPGLLCQPWGAGHSGVHKAGKNLLSGLWALNSLDIKVSEWSFVAPPASPKIKGSTPLPQEAAGGAQHNGHTLPQIPSLGFSNPNVFFGLGLGNGRFWVNQVTFSLSAHLHRWPGALSSRWGLILAPTRLYLPSGNLVKLSDGTASPLYTLPQSGSPGPFPPAPQTSSGFGLGHFSLVMLQWPPNWSSGLQALSLYSVLRGVVRASSQKHKAGMSFPP